MRALLLTGLLMAAPCFAGTALPDAPHVVTQGEGKATAKPDLARVTLSAQYRNANAANAKQSVDRGVEDFLKLAPEFGLTPDGIAEAWKSNPPSHPAFDAMVELKVALDTLPTPDAAVLEHAAHWVGMRFEAEKRRRAEMGFDDMLLRLDSALQAKVSRETHAGSMAINETLFQVAADDAPFGGIGASGMGHYHGHEGFLTFSKAKTVLTRGKFSTGALIHPPYRRWYQRLLLALLLR